MVIDKGPHLLPTLTFEFSIRAWNNEDPFAVFPVCFAPEQKWLLAQAYALLQV